MAKMGAPYGERHGHVTVPDATVREIRNRYFDQGGSPRLMAAEYQISEHTIWDWLKYRTRVHANDG